MKPSKCKYAAVDSAAEAVELLDEYGDDAKVLAGGQSLIPLMNLRLAQPGLLVDINRVSELAGIHRDGGLTIGAMTRQANVERSDDVRSYAPIVTEAVHHIAHPGIRTRGTFGGIAAHADPAAELPAVLLALDAEFTIIGPSGEHTVRADDFFVSVFSTVIADNELLVNVHLPYPSNTSRWAFHEVARRHGDFALVGVAATAEVDESSLCTQARVALSGVGDRPIRLKEAEQALVDRQLGEAADEAGRVAAEQLDPPADMHATKTYRKKVAGALVRRAAMDMAISGGAK